MPAHAELTGQFGKYRIVKKIGEGGMGAVYLAEDVKLGRKIALKVATLTSVEAIGRFQREARAAASIDHPNICQVLEVDCVDNIHYLTMPFVEGMALDKAIDPRRMPSPAQAVEWVTA